MKVVYQIDRSTTAAINIDDKSFPRLLLLLVIFIECVHIGIGEKGRPFGWDYFVTGE